jgi:hypothetical protein
MTRLPDLERALRDAATRFDEARPRRWWRTLPALATGSGLLLAAAALGATQLLPIGEPVSQAPSERNLNVAQLDPGGSQLLTVRQDDPEGGLPWGLAVHRRANGGLFCAQVGRVQGGRLGVIGRDGAFQNDGRFHPLAPDANQGVTCGGLQADGGLVLATEQPPIPASGYTGSFDSPVGGCRERVDPSSMSEETREAVRDVPVCDDSSLRLVKYGFAGRDAVSVEYSNQHVHLTATPSPEESGAYLFVLLPQVARDDPLTLTIIYRDGTRCSASVQRQVQSRACPSA